MLATKGSYDLDEYFNTLLVKKSELIILCQLPSCVFHPVFWET